MNKHASGFLEFGFYATIPDEIHKEFMDTTIAGLLDEYENTITRFYLDQEKCVEKTIVGDYNRRKHILLLICNRLSLIRASDAVEIMYEINENTDKKIEALTEQFKDHRHSRDKTYSEKPVW